MVTDLVKELQKQQYHHDLANHFDIVSLHRIDRLKHYGLHYAKYVGRLARGDAEEKPRLQTVVDMFLVALSCANVLNQDASQALDLPISSASLENLADSAGRFADACEKADHLEEFIQAAKDANLNIIRWVFVASNELGIDIRADVLKRRSQLAERQVYSRL